MGRVYVAVVLVGGGGPLGLALGSDGGFVAHVGFGMLAVLWLTATVQAYRRIRAGDQISHRDWMIRSFALTLAAVALRLYLPLSQIAGIPFADAYQAVAWACWVPNLIVAEWLVLRRPAASGRSTASQSAPLSLGVRRFRCLFPRLPLRLPLRSPRLSRKAVVVAICLVVAGLHLVTGPSYRGPFRAFVTGYLIDLVLPFALVLLLGVGLDRSPKLSLPAVRASAVIAVGFAVEVLQYFGVPLFGRTFDVLDVFMYAAGATAALAFERLVFASPG